MGHDEHPQRLEFSSARGEGRLRISRGDAPAVEAVSLGAIARELRQQHAQVKKSRVVWVNQSGRPGRGKPRPYTSVSRTLESSVLPDQPPRGPLYI